MVVFSAEEVRWRRRVWEDVICMALRVRFVEGDVRLRRCEVEDLVGGAHIC